MFIVHQVGQNQHMLGVDGDVMDLTSFSFILIKSILWHNQMCGVKSVAKKERKKRKIVFNSVFFTASH